MNDEYEAGASEVAICSRGTTKEGLSWRLMLFSALPWLLRVLFVAVIVDISDKVNIGLSTWQRHERERQAPRS